LAIAFLGAIAYPNWFDIKHVERYHIIQKLLRKNMVFFLKKIAKVYNDLTL